MSTITIKNTGTEPKAFANVPYMNPGDEVEIDESRKEEILADKDIEIVKKTASATSKKTPNRVRGNETEDSSFRGVETD